MVIEQFTPFVNDRFFEKMASCVPHVTAIYRRQFLDPFNYSTVGEYERRRFASYGENVKGYLAEAATTRLLSEPDHQGARYIPSAWRSFGP